MSTQTVFIPAGSVSNTIDIALVQSSTGSNPGDPYIGAAFNTSGFTCYRRVGPTSTPTAVALVTQTVGGAFTAGGFVQLDSTHMPGSYRFDMPNSLLPTSGEANFCFTGISGCATHYLKVIVTQTLFLGAMAEAYPAPGATANIPQALYATMQFLRQANIVGTTWQTRGLDGTTIKMTFTMNDPANPTNFFQAS